MSNFWRALYDYEGLDSTQISFTAGDVFLVSEVHDGGWFTAERGADIGYVPSNYLEPLREGDGNGDIYGDRAVVGEEGVSYVSGEKRESSGRETYGTEAVVTVADSGVERQFEVSEAEEVTGARYDSHVTNELHSEVEKREKEIMAGAATTTTTATATVTAKVTTVTTETEEERVLDTVEALEERGREGESEDTPMPPSITLQATAEGARVTCIPGSSGAGRQRLSRLAGSPAPNIVSVQKLRSPVVVRHRSKPNYAPEAMVASALGKESDSERRAENSVDSFTASLGDSGTVSGSASPSEPPPLPEGPARAYTPSQQFPPIPPRLDLFEEQEETARDEEELIAGSSSGPVVPLRSSSGNGRSLRTSGTSPTAMPLRSSSGRLPPPVPDNYQAPREHIELLERGGVFQRYTAKRRKPQQRFFSVSMQPDVRIQWREVEKKKFSSDNSLPLSEATAILEGHKTPVFQRHVKNGTARSSCLAFSVVFGGGPDAETLDLEAATESLCGQWFDALSSLYRQLTSQ